MRRSFDKAHNEILEHEVFYFIQEVFAILRRSFDKAHNEILEREGGLTTLCAAMVVPVAKSSQFAVCSLNVGDSYGYIFSHNQGECLLLVVCF